MTEKIIINTESEEHALIPDKWVVGTGLSTNSLYVTHTQAPLVVIQCPLENEEDCNEEPLCTVYVRGEIRPEF